MGFDDYYKYINILNDYPTLNNIFGGRFLQRKYQQTRIPYIFKRLVDQDEQFIRKYFVNLNSKLNKLENTRGFDRLRKGLKSQKWDYYYETIAQIQISVWFCRNEILKEIEPRLMNNSGSCDLLIEFQSDDIYVEVTSVRFNEDATGEKEVVPILISKLKNKSIRQLPKDYPGIIAFETGRIIVTQNELKEPLDELLTDRENNNLSHVMLIMLYSDEGGTGGQPPFWFINRGSKFQCIGKNLLEYLGQMNKAIGLG